MSWLVTFAAAILGAIGACLGMFAIAEACVKWYRISNFEGGAGYYVVGLSLVGGIAGFLVAFIAARIAYSYAGHGWYIQLGGALGAIVVGLLLVLALTYFGSDHTPELGGQG